MKYIKYVLASLATFVFISAPLLVSAQVNTDDPFGLEPGKQLITSGGETDLRAIIVNIINVFMGFLGTVAVCIILFGGFKWMTAGGDSKGTEQARKLIINGIIGLVIVLTSYAIARFVLTSLMAGTGVSGSL